MGLSSILNYVLITNPISSGTAYYTSQAFSTMKSYLGFQPAIQTQVPLPLPLWKLAAVSGPYVRLAAISGAAAVILRAYGYHKQEFECKFAERKEIFKMANLYHFIHTLALLGVPLCRAHYLVAFFFTCGMIMFCGSCYYKAFTGNRQFDKVTMFGGISFIIGWLCMCI